MSKFTGVLRNRNFFLLWLGQIISQVGDRLGQMALIGLATQRSPGSALAITKIIIITIIPVFLFGPVAGVYVDRWDRRRTMYLSDILRAVFMLVIPLFLFSSQTLIPIYIIIFIVFSIGRFFVPAKFSIIPELVGKNDLLIANSLVHTTGMIAAILGFGISGILVEWMGPKGGFYLDALSFLVSGIIIFFIVTKSSRYMNFKKVSREIVEVIRKSVLRETKEGILYFIQNKDIRFAGGIMFTLWSALGAVGIVLIVFVQNALNSATLDLGLLAMFLGIGLFLGSLIYGRFGHRLSHYKVIFASLILSGLTLNIIAIIIERYPHFPIAALLFSSLGLVISPIMIASFTIIHKTSDSDMMGKTFSSLDIISHLGLITFMLIGALLAERLSHLLLLIIIGYILSILGIISLIFHRKIPWLD